MGSSGVGLTLVSATSEYLFVAMRFFFEPGNSITDTVVTGTSVFGLLVVFGRLATIFGHKTRSVASPRGLPYL